MGRQWRCCLFVILFHVLVVSGSVVKHLPGFDGPLPFELETGYVGVGESDDVQLFYYFIKSERNPQDDPLMIWLTGGPACSSICGMLFENGPLAFKGEEYNGSVPTLVKTSFSWTKVASIIYLDSPAGSGYSYARTTRAFESSDTKQMRQIDQFLRKWLTDHLEFVSNPFYVGGDSYSGKVVPGVVQQISRGNGKGITPLINLQGYLLGNPLTDDNFDYNHRIPFAHGMGLISDELYESLQRSCGNDYFNMHPSNAECLNGLRAYDTCVSDIYTEQILLPNCEVDYVMPTRPDGRRELKESRANESSLPPPSCFTYRYFLSAFWANDENVRRALHVKKGIGKWKRCNTVNIPYTYDVASSVPYHLNNSRQGFRSLIYSGDHDLMVPFMATEAWIRDLNFPIVDRWRPWMINDQIAGYTRTYSNKMTFATIKGGGHTADYRPDECGVMFKRWIDGEFL